jgi:NAD(P) transhydrogenase subunit beta
MTEMPQLVAALHSFVGAAAVFIGWNADIELGRVERLREQAASGVEGAAERLESLTGFAAVLAHKTPVEVNILLVEIFLGVFIGAVTLTGSWWPSASSPAASTARPPSSGAATRSTRAPRSSRC